MKRISFWLLIFAFTAMTARAQDAETTERLNKLEGYIQDMQAAQADQKKQIQALEKEIADLRDKINQPGANNYAGADDLQKLAKQVQDLADKQQKDNELIMKQLEKLGKVTAGSTASHKSSPPSVSTASTDDSAPNPAPAGSPQKGFYYEIQNGNTLTAIAKAYRDQGVKVTVDQILKANPGLDPKNLIVGKKIFIPAPAQ